MKCCCDHDNLLRRATRKGCYFKLFYFRAMSKMVALWHKRGSLSRTCMQHNYTNIASASNGLKQWFLTFVCLPNPYVILREFIEPQFFSIIITKNRLHLIMIQISTLRYQSASYCFFFFFWRPTEKFEASFRKEQF